MASSMSPFDRRHHGAPMAPFDGAQAVGDDPEPSPESVAISRRATLAGVTALAAGIGVSAVAGNDSMPTPRNASPVFNVRDFGARGDGTTDDTRKIQAAIDAARGNGGTVFFPPGTFLTRRLTLHSRVHLRGSGGDATVLKLAPGADSAIIESDGFASLTGTRSTRGITLFSVRDLALDGNKAHNHNAGYGLRVYGYGYELTELIVFNCRNDGVRSEWGPGGNLPGGSHQMEARLSAVRSHDNAGDGISYAGPHDSMFLNCLAFHNTGAGFRLTGDSLGTLMVNCHAWGAKQDLSFDLAAAGIGCMNCYADIDGGVGVRISRSDCRWIGGLVLGNNHTGSKEEIGVRLAPGLRPEEPAGCVIDTKIINCGTAAVDFGADRGLSSIRATLSQPGVKDGNGQTVAGSGRGWMGAPAPTTRVELTEGLGNNDKNLVILPAFDLREQGTPAHPAANSARIFARDAGGKTQLCVLFPSGAVQVIATEP